jgi:site-specific DNA recombinase
VTTALVYVRQSRHKAFQHTVSPEVQQEACRALPAVAACDAVEVFSDLDVSGGKRTRRGYDAMLARLGAGGVSVVAAYDQSRAFRSIAMAAKFKELLEETANASIQVVFVHGSFDRSAVGGFSYAVLAAAHQMERELTAEKIKAAYAYMNARGYPTGGAGYGFRYVGGTRASGALEVDEAQAAVVRRMFAEYAAGGTARTLAETLNLEGVPPPGRRGEWIPDTVAQMLASVTYVGKTYAESRRRKAGEIVPAQWPALVDEGLFQRVQDRLKSFRVPSHTRRRELALRGLVWCACGERMWCQTTGGVVYVYCGSRRRAGACEQAREGVREDALTPWVDALVDAWAAKGIRASRLMARPAAAPETAAEAAAKIGRMVTRLGKRFQYGEIDEDEYASELARMRAQQAVYAAAAAEEPDPRELDGVVGLWRSGDAAKRREMLGSLFERLHVRGGRIVGYTPRADRARRVTLLVDSFLADAEHEPELVAANIESGGEGGI